MADACPDCSSIHAAGAAACGSDPLESERPGPGPHGVAEARESPESVGAEAPIGLAATTPDGPPAGRHRSFLVSLVLVVLTLGLYGLYYHYKVFEEVDRQEGQRHMAGFYVSIVAIQLLAAFVATGVAGAAGAAGAGPEFANAGQPPEPEQPLPAQPPIPTRPSPDAPEGRMAPPAFILGLIGTLGWCAYILMEAAVLNQGLVRHGQHPAATFLVPLTALGGFFASHLRASFGVVLLLALLGLIGYALLQDGLNRYWTAVASGEPPEAAGTAQPAGG